VVNEPRRGFGAACLRGLKAVADLTNTELHIQLSDLLCRYDINEYAASVRMYALKPLAIASRGPLGKLKAPLSSLLSESPPTTSKSRKSQDGDAAFSLFFPSFAAG
jgi:hypothetical protein